jgi:long-chain fatty acid transport protein
MKHIMIKTLALSTLTTSLLFASGYRLPESSLNATALSAAYIANAHGADAAYYNPANMAFNSNHHTFEGALTYINLGEISYTDNLSPLFNGKSKEENLFAPSFFLTSKDYNGVRYGLSMTVPGGLSKRWESPFAKLFAQEFTLKIIELNPVASYKVSENFAFGGGLRMIYSEGIVKSNGMDITTASGGMVNKPAARDMEADTVEFGYNIAATYKPDVALTLSATYRSNVNINEEGNAKLYLSGTKLYDGGASVEVPLPAVASLAAAYDFGGTVLELEYDKTFWSEYKMLDFQFKDIVPLALQAAFDAPKPRNWEDTNAFRVGITHQLNEKLTVMGGFALDENPAPEANLGFELPDSDATLYSGGFRYQYSDALSIGASFLYDAKDDRKVVNDDINGEFKDASALLVTTGFSYKF